MSDEKESMLTFKKCTDLQDMFKIENMIDISLTPKHWIVPADRAVFTNVVVMRHLAISMGDRKINEPLFFMPH